MNRPGPKPTRYPVYGEWLSIGELAARLGVSYEALRLYRSRHRDRDGRPPDLEAVCEHYRAVQAGTIPCRPGRAPKRHRVNGRLMTIAEAAEALGVARHVLACHMSRHRCGLARAYHDIENLQARRAEREILRILQGAKRG